MSKAHKDRLDKIFNDPESLKYYLEERAKIEFFDNVVNAATGEGAAFWNEADFIVMENGDIIVIREMEDEDFERLKKILAEKGKKVTRKMRPKSSSAIMAGKNQAYKEFYDSWLPEIGKTRNPDRIGIIMSRIITEWENHPDMRLGQLIGNILSHGMKGTFERKDLLLIEDLEFYKFLTEYRDNEE